MTRSSSALLSHVPSGEPWDIFKEPVTMEIDADKVLFTAIQEGIREGIKSKMSGYNSPFDKLIADAVAKNGPALQSVLSDAIASCLSDTDFRASIAEQVRSQLAKQLIQKFGGELEKTVNQLKSDPATRARITLAVEEIVRVKA